MLECIQDKDGRVITDEDGILKQWKRYVEELYTGQDIHENITENENNVEDYEIRPPI